MGRFCVPCLGPWLASGPCRGPRRSQRKTLQSVLLEMRSFAPMRVPPTAGSSGITVMGRTSGTSPPAWTRDGCPRTWAPCLRFRRCRAREQGTPTGEQGTRRSAGRSAALPRGTSRSATGPRSGGSCSAEPRRRAGREAVLKSPLPLAASQKPLVVRASWLRRRWLPAEGTRRRRPPSSWTPTPPSRVQPSRRRAPLRGSRPRREGRIRQRRQVRRHRKEESGCKGRSGRAAPAGEC
mmetsp:Transcript_69408/g.219266  ORF Transcript_69408/g.219266 Transcript_69408/m.219266 type:complete len:237 (-) Transcript_69408:33-743(-)